MMREPTFGERVLRAVGTVALVMWCAVVIVLALGYLGPNSVATWAGRIGLLVVGTLITTGLVRVGVRAWRRAIARPLPAGRSSRWLARQPGWRIAIGCWALYGAPELGTGLWLSYSEHHAVATASHIAWLVWSVFAACLVALLCRVLWQRQAENGRSVPVTPSP